jgi:hypothetical protein
MGVDVVGTQGLNDRGRVWGCGRGGPPRVALWVAGAVMVLLVAVPSLAVAKRPVVSTTEPASKYDAGGQTHDDVCANPRLSPLGLRYLSGGPTGFQLSNALTFTTSGGCQTGQIRLDLHEVVDSGAGPLVFHRGGSGYVDAENVRYGQVLVSELNGRLPRPVSSGGGRGAPCKTLSPQAYQASVQPIPQDMKYKSPAAAGGNNAGASYLHYGDPATQQGDQNPQKYSTDPTQQIHYSTLTWSWIDVSGGGHNRILLAPGQDIRLCDVAPIRRDSWAPSSLAPDGQLNGWVIARYVQTRVGNGPALYGWMVWQHHYDGDGSDVVVDHFRPV